MKWVAPAVFGCAVFSAAARPSAAESTCDPVAIVDGDPALVSSLSAQLVRRGIAIDGATDIEDPCPAVRATVAPGGEGVSVTVTEAGGEPVARDVTTTEIAAIWIESRMRRDVGAPLLAVRVPAVAPGPAPGAVAPAVARPDADVAARYVAPGRDRLSVGVRIENGSANDGSSWRSYSGSMCVEAGPLCVGLLGRLGENEEVVREEGFTAATRDDKEVMVSAAWPLRAGQLRFMPQVGAGYGSMRTRQLGEVFEPIGPEGMLCGTDPDLAGECSPLDVTTSGGRLSAGLTVTIPLHDRLALDLGVSAKWLAGAHVAPHERTVLIEDVPPAPDDMCPDGDPSCEGRYHEETYLYPGEPSRLFHMGIGLRVGLP